MIKSNYFKVPNNIKTNRNLNANEKLVLMVLYSFANNDKLTCFPSFDTLAEYCSLSRSTTIRTINTLEKKNFIIKIRRMNKGECISNLYKLLPSLENINIISLSVTQTPLNPEHVDFSGLREGGSVTLTPLNPEHVDFSGLREGGSVTLTPGSVTQTLGVVSHRHPNYTKKELNSLNKTNTTTNSCCVLSKSNQTVFDVKELKTKIENTIRSSISYKCIANLLLSSNPEKINYYIENWEKFLNRNINNTTAFFISAVKNQYEIPKQYNVSKNNIQNQNYIPQHHNFEQRKYTDEDFDGFYANVPQSKTS